MRRRDGVRRVVAALLVAGVTTAATTGCRVHARPGGAAPSAAPATGGPPVDGCPAGTVPAASGAFAAAAPPGWHARPDGGDAADGDRAELAFAPDAGGGPDGPLLTVRSRDDGGTTLTTTVSRLVAERRGRGHALLGEVERVRLDGTPARLFATSRPAGPARVDDLHLAARRGGRTYLTVLTFPVTPASRPVEQVDRLQAFAGSWCWA